MIKFDLYQNGVASALQCVASKLNWGAKRATSEGKGPARGGEGGEGGGNREKRREDRGERREGERGRNRIRRREGSGGR